MQRGETTRRSRLGPGHPGFRCCKNHTRSWAKEIRINGNTYETPESCPLYGPLKSTLKRHLTRHGVEAFLASNKYGQYATCILDELRGMGAEAVETAKVTEALLESHVTSSEALSDSAPVAPADEALEDE